MGSAICGGVISETMSNKMFIKREYKICPLCNKRMKKFIVKNEIKYYQCEQCGFRY